MTTVHAIKCVKCKDTIYSRARHDFNSCSCGGCSIDGGLDYTKICWEPDMDCPEPFSLEIEATPRELYDDWDTNANKFGRIKHNG